MWVRRWFVLGPATKVEYDLRTEFYARLQNLPVVVPRPLAVGPAAQPHDAGHQHDPPLARVRPRAARRQHDHDRGRHRHPVPLALAARGDLHRHGDAALGAGIPVREALRRAHPAEPGPGGRPGHGRRGERARHPRAEGLRSRQARAPQLRPPGGAPARDRARQGARDRRRLVLARADARHRLRAVPRRRHLADLDRAA